MARIPLSVLAPICMLGAAAALAGCGGTDEPGSERRGGREPAAQQPADGQRPPPPGDGRGGVRLTKVGEFEAPVHVAQPRGDDHLFVVEQGGRIMRLRAGAKPETFLDISGEVSCCGEQGLLSVAFAPDYARSGLFYVDYTNRAGDTRVVEYRRRGGLDGLPDPGSARQVLAVDQPFPNHNGGLLLFGPDDRLYVGLGDGGSGGDPMRNGQSLATLLGKILRIDPRPPGGAAGPPYAIPPGNPFAGGDGERRAEIYSYGLRNPWRFSFDRATGALWIGDVGQDELEEIDGVRRGAGAGANFGWSAFEGDARFNEDEEAPQAVAPVLTYSHDDGSCSVTGGYVVRDPRLSSLYGRYLYGDYCLGELRSFTAAPARAARDDRPLGVPVPRLTSFGEGAGGRVYATSAEGPVYRLDPSP